MFTNIKTLVQVLKILTVWTLKNSQTHAKKWIEAVMLLFSQWN